ncbi:MAG TPA: DUF3617 family protein [Terracidiphilus sp.]|nr:DUF3617 family protein [Terracidiphilus sp.]
MKNPFLKTNSLPGLFALGALALAASALAQLSEVPPVNMGLWETQTTGTASGIENTPMAGMAAMFGRQHVTQSCLTPESWKNDIQGLNSRQQRGCTLSNVHQDAHEVSFDQACSNGMNNAHVDILIDGPESAHGTIVMKIALPNMTQPMTVNMTMSSHRLGSDCGGVKPGQGKMIQ